MGRRSTFVGARRILAVGVFAVLLLPAVPARADFVRCDPAGSDAGAIAAAREAIDAACPCEPSITSGDHARCALGVLRDRVADGSLRKACRVAVQRCASWSTCGREGAVGCCVTLGSGAQRAKIARRAELCRAPRGGSAEVSEATSVCDACGGAGPTATPAPQPTPGATCGNGKIEPGERCDGGPLCFDCKIAIPYCCSFVSSYCGAEPVSSAAELAHLFQLCSSVSGTLSGLTECVPTGAGIPKPEGYCTPYKLDPVDLCCEGAPGGYCLSFRGDDPAKLGDFVGACWGLSGGTGRPLLPGTIVQGTCGVTGHCVHSSP